MADYKCKFCSMAHLEDYDVYYGQSTHWICVGDKETGNPLFIYKKHYHTNITDDQREEVKVLAASLIAKYWKNIKLEVKSYSYSHPHIEISEVTNALPAK